MVIENKSLKNHQFDVVIVGAGSAGCALAGRLSEDPSLKIALVEAGGRDTNPWIHIPVGYFRTMGNPGTDWRYVTQADAGIAGRAIAWPRGRVLGGSSSINGLLYVRGQPQDFDQWRQLGNAGWGWDDVLPYFKRAENWENGADDHRGGDGPLRVSNSRLTRPIIDGWIEAAVNAGYARNSDYNGADQEGVGYFQLTAHNGRRCSAAVAYLRDAQKRPNLTVFPNHQVKGLVFDGARASGIEAMGADGVAQRFSGREVVLSAGAIGSPQILMLSGIGPEDELTRHGITPRHVLSGVGQNLQDHLQARPVFKTPSSTMNTETNSLIKKAMMAAEYALRRTGPMTMAASLGTGFLKTRPELETPDIQFHIQPWSADKPSDGPHKFSAFTASVLQLRPESAGHIALASKDYRDHPLIHPNYLATQTDQRTLVDGIKIARKIAATAPLAQMITDEHAPGLDVGLNDDAAILDWARRTATTIYHPTGTCKMGQDEGAVVDDRLKVHGVPGLRIADASIMPVITSGNTNAPCIMIGEKLADMLKADLRA